MIAPVSPLERFRVLVDLAQQMSAEDKRDQRVLLLMLAYREAALIRNQSTDAAWKAPTSEFRTVFKLGTHDEIIVCGLRLVQTLQTLQPHDQAHRAAPDTFLRTLALRLNSSPETGSDNPAAALELQALRLAEQAFDLWTLAQSMRLNPERH